MTDDRWAQLESKLDTILEVVHGTNARVGALEARFDALEARFDALEARVTTLEATVQQLAKDTAEMWRELVARIDAKSDELRQEMLAFRAELSADIHESHQIASRERNFIAKGIYTKIEMLDRRLTGVERHFVQQAT